MNEPRPGWSDLEPGPLVRPYAVSRGRTRAVRADLDVATLVVEAHEHYNPQALDAEYEQILAVCRRPISVVEIAAYLRLPLLVTKVLISDLIDNGYLLFRSRSPAQLPDHENLDLLQAVFDGIQRI